MTTQYVVEADFDALASATLRTNCFVDENDAYSATIFDRAAELASAWVESLALNAGYSIATDEDGSSTTDDMVKLATLIVLVVWAYEKKEQDVPEFYGKLFDKLPDGLKDGDTPLKTITPNPLTAVGGSKFSESTAGVTGAKPQIFGKLGELL